MKLVVVESPAKAKTIHKYLGVGYKVIASYGHIRDLPSKNGSVDPNQNFAMVWDSEPKNLKHIAEIVQSVKGADALYLATDPDREGEAIAWHIQEVLKARKVLNKVSIHRSVFNEITKTSVQNAIQNPRQLDQQLIDAYLARRALDYLVGFNLSPVLWRKLPGSKSAGRVQSVALRLITEREAEIEKFITQEYWTLEGEFLTKEKDSFLARLTHWEGEKLDKFSIPNKELAEKIKGQVEIHDYTIQRVETKKTQRHPAAPFITSTLQQEAARKLGFSASFTMQLAQKLYEGIDINGEHVGLITYMRTDSVHLNRDAVKACQDQIKSMYGEKYGAPSPRLYKSKVKNAQEAHEAIRPTNFEYSPEYLKRFLDPKQLKLYDLIWKRTLACQMASAILDQTTIDVASADKKVQWRATGSTIVFEGFLKVYQEGKDEDTNEAEQNEDKEKFLPPVQRGDKTTLKSVKADQHFTQPPPRYTEASLVKKLEELGIGRPSTYASILHVLQARQYVRLDKKQFIPEERGRLVIAFLENYFTQYVEYNFTANLEDELDDISQGKISWLKVLEKFWKDFHGAIDKAQEIKITDVLDFLDETLGGHFFPPRQDGKDPRECPDCTEGRLHLKLGKFGAFIGCTRYPECKHTHRIEEVEEDPTHEAPATTDYPKELGVDPSAKEMVTLRHGPYGFYVQLGEGTKKDKPKRAPLMKGMHPQDVTLKSALSMLELPREVGHHPETKQLITAGVGRFGPYLKYDNKYVSVKEHNILTITLNEAVDVLANHKPSAGKPMRAKSQKKTATTPVKKTPRKKT